MQDELVTIETAKVAKEKGFDWECIYCVYLKRDNKVVKEPKIEFQGAIMNWTSKDNPFQTLSIPFKSLLQRWLREVYGIHIEIYFNQFQYCSTILGKGQVIDKGFTFDTYELALEEALQEGLKLI